MRENEETVRKLMGKVIEIAIVEIMENHCFQFNNKFYKQGKGGAIGLRLTGVIARVIMDRWMRRVKMKMKEAGMEIHLIEKFVDDIMLQLHLRSCIRSTKPFAFSVGYSLETL